MYYTQNVFLIYVLFMVSYARSGKNYINERMFTLMNKKRKQTIHIPDTYLIILAIMLIVSILSYILPAGTYDTITDPVTGKSVVDANSFHFIERSPITFTGYLLSITKGLVSNSNVIFFAFLVCGFFQIITDTGAMDRLIDFLVTKFSSHAFIILPVFGVMMCLLGSTGMMLTPTIALIPIGLALAKKLKVDQLFGVAIIYCCIFGGFGGSPYAPNSIVLAQEFADIEPMSGFLPRAIMWVLITAVTILYLMRYAKKVQQNPENSIMDVISFPETASDEQASANSSIFCDALVVLSIFVGFGIYIYGAITKNWGLDYMNGIFFVVGVFSGIMGKMKPQEIVNSFVKGCKNFVYGGILIGLAGSISILLEEGMILHTLIYYLSLPLKQMPAVVSSILMYVVDLICNFFIPSVTGKAPIVMPLMAPLADVIGLSRQLSVSAYAFSDAFGNTFIPTHAILISSLSIANVPFEKWVRFQIPLFLIWSLLSCGFLVLSTLFGF